MRTSALIIVVLAGLASAGFFVFSVQSGDSDVDTETPSLAQYFFEQAQERVVEQIGQPIEGFEPFMFRKVFPELTSADFDGVGTLQGVYQEASGELAFILTVNEPEHSAARAISEGGMETLLQNIASRLSISINSENDIDILLDTIDGVEFEKDIVGMWRSTDDAKFTREFHGNGGVVDRYEGDDRATSVGEWAIIADPTAEPVQLPVIKEATYLRIVFAEETLYYTVSELARDTLQLVFLDRGGALNFERDLSE